MPEPSRHWPTVANDAELILRDDGVRVTRAHGGWIILRDGSAPIAYCPCCGFSFDTARAAMLVADQCYPNPKDAA